MRAALLAVFLVSCAAPSGRTYRDGVPVERAPVFVTPGYAPAGAGLPEYMPTAQRETVPRGTDRRVLPPTREPGIWASDGDETRARPTPSRMKRLRMLLGVELPLVDEDPTGHSTRLTNGCAMGKSHAAKMSGQDAKALALPIRARECLAARLYLACARGDVNRHEQTKGSLEFYDPPLLQAQKATEQKAADFAREKCDGIHWDGELNDIYTTIQNWQERDPNDVAH